MEILLDSYGVCNLTTVNMTQFIREDSTLDLNGLIRAQELSARAGLRMTLAELELPHWNAVQQRDRLLGTSLTGVKDTFSQIQNNEKHVLAHLGTYARKAADDYAKEMRVNSPLLVTTVKPEGTLSQVMGGVSSGLHMNHAPHYIRRIRINAIDPLAKAVQAIGWQIHAEVGTQGYTEEADLAKPEVIAQARTLVIDFPVESGASKTKDDVDVNDQFDTYFRFQDVYTEHNSSNTIGIKAADGEWEEAESIVWERWDEFIGVSFLSHDGGSYVLAPYETCNREEYEELKARMVDFTPDMLEQFETGLGSDLEGADGCEGGACPIR